MTTSQLDSCITEVVKLAVQVPGRPGTTVTIAAACGTNVDLPDAEWLAAFNATGGSIDDERFHRPEQPVIDPIPAFDF